MEWVFVKGKGWTHQRELKPGDQYQLKDGGWGTYQPEKIEATGGHPFWVISGEDLDKRLVPQHCPAEVPDAAIPGRWVNAIDLRVGDIVFTRDGRHVPITNVSVRHVKMKVYNLQVEELENYAVGQMGILVHNTSGSPIPDYSQLPAKGNAIGSGAEGTVYELPGYPDWVLKEFKPGTVAIQASNEANNLDALRQVFGDRHVVQTVTPPRRFAPGQPVVLLKQKVTIVVGGEDQAALKVIVDTLKQNNITADVGKNLVWGHTGDGIPRWIWIE